MNVVDLVCTILRDIFLVLTAYKWIYFVIGFFAKKKVFKETENFHKYAVVVCARNEEKVLPKLLESIKLQDYPKDKLDYIVVADNCTDRTAEISRELGAKVYERFDTTKQRKGYALEFLFNQIQIDEYEGYFIMDADNLLAPTFVKEMNKAFDEGHKIITGYRNSKNFDTNIISSGYGLHFYSNNMAYHRPRQCFNFGTHLTGTGYLFDSSLIKDIGWHFTNLTEDDEFTIYADTVGVRIAFCEDAIFYDEQPLDAKTAFRQRVRWARGRLIAFVKNIGKLWKSIFTQKNFTGYDLFWHYFPTGMITWALGIVYPIVSISTNLIMGVPVQILPILKLIGSALLITALYGLISSILAVIKEKDRVHCKNKGKLVLYIICSPWFLLVDTLHNLVALFYDIKWTPIKHVDDRGIENVH